MVKIAACAQARQPLPYFIPRKYAEQRKVEIFPKLDQMFNLALFNYTVRKFRWFRKKYYVMTINYNLTNCFDSTLFTNLIRNVLH